MLSCFDVAEYLIAIQDEEAGELLTNLKLQKLLYYSQGFHLAFFGKPLFEEKIIAWAHGPVVPEIYYRFRNYGASPIPKNENFDASVFPPEVVELLNEINRMFGQYSAWKLRNMTHEEKPWKSVEINDEITPDILRDYFRTQISE